MPLEVDRQELKSELAFARLLAVNNNIKSTDYGQGFYDDKPTHPRKRRIIVDRHDYVKPEEEEIDDDTR